MGCARLATPRPQERLAGELAAWADQGKAELGRGKRRGAQGTAGPREPGCRERGGAEGVFFFIYFSSSLFLLFFLKTRFSFEFKFKHDS
jgi:hypothetical protein